MAWLGAEETTQSAGRWGVYHSPQPLSHGEDGEAPQRWANLRDLKWPHLHLGEPQDSAPASRSTAWSISC